ncbi:E3 ubiquitin-protein ligase rnf213-alpha-like [Anguilla rostrata]|uniref:E3 ubiquitin-protein ligase rnf213-alpha-like n=1 Tax=Anguilla rostrata TaxID=7938 RepID=UPI0030CFF46E
MTLNVALSLKLKNRCYSCLGCADLNELKVFVDLASISAGENDLDVDRVACFHDAVLGYSSVLYELKPDAGFQAFKEALGKLWKALKNDRHLPEKLRDTARNLEWLKTVKESHGSVELSSLSLASAINKKGLYIIRAQNQKKLTLDTTLKLEILEGHTEQSQQQEVRGMRSYSLEDLQELLNRLMLMSGRGAQGQRGEVDNFSEFSVTIDGSGQELTFDDESWFQLYRADGRQRVWCRVGERFADVSIVNRVAHGGGGALTCHPLSMFGMLWTSTYDSVFQFPPMSNNFVQLLKRSGTIFHRLQSTI